MAFPVWIALAAGAVLLLAASSAEDDKPAAGEPGAPLGPGCLPKAADSLAELLLRLTPDQRAEAAQVLNSKGQVHIGQALSEDVSRSDLKGAIVSDLRRATPERLREISTTIGQFAQPAPPFDAAAVWSDVQAGDFSSTIPAKQAEYDAFARRATLAIQGGLNGLDSARLGRGPLDVDGQWGPATREAWAQFMDSQGLSRAVGQVQQPGVVRLGQLLNRPPIEGAQYAADCIAALATEKEAA